MRELRVEDALLYLDQVKVEFGDRPHIYNEFLEIMKTFKTQQIDTPGVIRRVSNLFKGNRRLVLGFNTFLPEGYQIELPPDGNGPPVAVYRAPGSNVTQILRESAESQAHGMGGGGAAAVAQPALASQQQQQQPGGLAVAPAASALHPLQHGGEAAAATASFGPALHGHMAAVEQDRLEQAASLTHQAPVELVAGRQAALAGLPGQGPAALLTGKPSPPGQHAPQQASPAVAEEEAPAPLEFDHAINYVTTIKKRFSSEPEIYKRFLEILHTYQREQRGIKDVLEDVSTLFADHADLLREFTYFLPDAVQAQAKAQLDQVAKECEARKRSQAKEAIMNTAQTMQKNAMALTRPRPPDYDSTTIVVPFGATKGRSEEQEQSIISSAQYGLVSFDPVRPGRREELTPAQTATRLGRPVVIPPLPRQSSTAEAAFFERSKEHLERRELQSERPPGSRKHTPYVEFLKCLHIFGAGIVNRDELLLLLRSLFSHGHAPKSSLNFSGTVGTGLAVSASELLREVEELLVSRGPFAEQEAASKDKSKYGSLSRQAFDFEDCEHPTPSYFAVPDDFPSDIFVSNAGQTQTDASVLQDSMLCVGSPHSSKTQSIEACDGAKARRNVYEDMMFRVEDERYEIDMAIERNAQALRQIEPFAEEAKRLRVLEEKEGQPIGRMQYRLGRNSLNTIHVNAIARVYGERGDEVLQHLIRNPMAVLPLVYQRLKQKDVEWRKTKAELSAKLNAVSAANYEGSLDCRCFGKRRALERRVALHRLRNDCEQAASLCQLETEKNSEDDTVSAFAPSFSAVHKDVKALLFQPHCSHTYALKGCHRVVLDLLFRCIKADKAVSGLICERVGRLFAEFLAPFFNFPSYWVDMMARESFSGSITPNIAKCMCACYVILITRLIITTTHLNFLFLHRRSRAAR